jgi:hypothetical protein
MPTVNNADGSIAVTVRSRQSFAAMLRILQRNDPGAADEIVGTRC